MSALTYLRLCVGALLFTLSFAAIAENAVTSDSASVRAGPDSSYPEVAQLDANSPVQVIGCLDDWSWCDVAFAGNRGWLYSPDITYEYEGGYVPLYSYAPALGVPVLSFSIDEYWGNHYHDRPWYAQRDQWVHRSINHRRPPGPPPSSSPPPHEAVRADKPRGGSQPDRPIRLGSADSSRRDTQQHQGTAFHPEPKADEPHAQVRPQGRAPDQGRGTDHAPSAAPGQRADVTPKPTDHVAPQRDDGHARPNGRPEPQSHQEQHPPADKSEGPPRKDERG